MTPSHGPDSAKNEALTLTQRWLERAVIGLNLCPFAKAVHVKSRVRFALSEAQTPQALIEDLVFELELLRDTDPLEVETTLLVHPQVLHDFLDYNDFLDAADSAVEALGLSGELQVASFHPQYRFAETSDDDMGNYSNRSPFPTLHLLRESSITRAVETYPDIDAIVARNIALLERLGQDGWHRALSESA